jgi:hypothetical protein
LSAHPRGEDGKTSNQHGSHRNPAKKSSVSHHPPPFFFETNFSQEEVLHFPLRLKMTDHLIVAKSFYQSGDPPLNKV